MSDEKKLNSVLKAAGKKFKDLRKNGSFEGGYVGFAIHQLQMQPKQYWELEEGKTNFTMKTLLKILEVHKITLEDFFKELQ